MGAGPGDGERRGSEQTTVEGGGRGEREVGHAIHPRQISNLETRGREGEGERERMRE